MNKIKNQILEECEDAQFTKGLESKLFGCAEMFGADCIVLYEGVNFIRYISPEECLLKSDYCNFHRKIEGGRYDFCIVGHVKLDEGDIRFVYDREMLIDAIKKEYMQDTSGLFKDEEDCEESAREYYDYNIIGSFMDGIPAFAVVLKE